MSKLNDIWYVMKVKYEDGCVGEISVSSSALLMKEIMQNLLSAKEIKILKETIKNEN